jgi:hypothetical protein
MVVRNTCGELIELIGPAAILPYGAEGASTLSVSQDAVTLARKVSLVTVNTTERTTHISGCQQRPGPIAKRKR